MKIAINCAIGFDNLEFHLKYELEVQDYEVLIF